jgi:hypothetical protein
LENFFILSVVLRNCQSLVISGETDCPLVTPVGEFFAHQVTKKVPRGGFGDDEIEHFHAATLTGVSHVEETSQKSHNVDDDDKPRLSSLR